MVNAIFGFLIGCMCGVVVTALCVAASHNDINIKEEESNE